jgi:DNA-binding Xre family transcriptional regulator
MPTQWKLEGTLQKYGKSPMSLARASGLTKTTIYSMVNGSSQAVQLETLDKLLSGLEKLTGKPMSVSDVLEREIKPNALLEEVLRYAKPVNWQELEGHIPDWSAAERSENERIALEGEQERLERITQQKERDTVLLEPFLALGASLNRNQTRAKKL